MRIIIFVSILAFISLSYVSQANYVDYQNDLMEEIILKAQAYENALSEFEFLEELKRIALAIQFIHDANPKGTVSPIQVIDQLSKINTDELCTKCLNAVYAARNDTDKDALRERFEKWAADVCDKVNNATFCSQMAVAYGNIVFPAIIDKSFDPELLCAKLHFCPDTTHKQVLQDYVNEVLKDKPATNIPVPTKKSTYTVLQIADIHIDLDYQEGANSICSQPLCCRASDGLPTNPAQAAGHWGTLANCDIPVRTFDQFLQFTSLNFDIDMILWTGDNIAHNIWEQSVDNQTVSTYDATQHILQYFPHTTLYPMFGNHEAFPSDEFDFTGNNSAWLTSQLAEMWKVWLDDNADNTLRNNSYYAMVNQEHNLKVIALDTLACDSNDMYLFENATDPQNQLAWLRNELYDSETNGQSVFIMGHIPPGSFACDSEWSSRYRALIDRFTNIIRGQFFAHTHNDQFEVVRSFADNSPVGVIYIAPSLTTYSYLNPSFRIFEIDSDTNVPINYYQYRLDLNKWNQNTTGPLQWDLAYDVISEYDLADMTYRSFDNLVEQIKENKDVTKLYSDNFYTGNPVNATLDSRDIQHLYCLAKNSVSKDAFKCLGLAANMNDILDMAEQMLPGSWTD